MRSRAPALAVIGILVVTGAIWAAGRATAHPSIVLDAAVVDFGPLAERATQAVMVRNVGRAPLRILAISTSCGCTTARIESTVLAPNGAASLAITFDPVAHGPTPGPARHAVYLRTDDPRTPEAEIQVRAVVVKKAGQ